MSMTAREILTLRVFDALPTSVADALRAEGRLRRFGRGETLFHEGDEGTSIYLVTAGRFRMHATTSQGREVSLAILASGDVFGDIAVLSSDSYRPATVTALEPSEVLMIPREAFERVRRDHPVLTEALLTVLADRLRFAVRRIVELVSVPAPERVRSTLTELAGIFGDNDPLLVPLSQQEIATIAGTSRDIVNRVLKEEERRGSLRVRRGAIEIRDEGAFHPYLDSD